MASVYVSDRTEKEKSRRIKCEDVDLSKDIAFFKEKISTITNKAQNEFELLYCGILLKDETTLESCGIKAGSTIHMLKKPKSVSSLVEAEGPMSNSEVKNVIATLQSALVNPAYRPTVDSLVNSPEALHDFVAAIPGLDADPATLAMFQNQDLMVILAHPGNIRRVMEAHPCFGKTAMMVAAAVHAAGGEDFPAVSAPGSYSLDQMSDDEDFAMAAPAAGAATPRGGGITASQLAAALAAASGSPRPSPPPRTVHSGENQPISGPLITSEFFQAAMQQAQSVAMQSQIQQMREMGITDENVARQALQATNGNLQAALDLLFGGLGEST